MELKYQGKIPSSLKTNKKISTFFQAAKTFKAGQQTSLNLSPDPKSTEFPKYLHNLSQKLFNRHKTQNSSATPATPKVIASFLIFFFPFLNLTDIFHSHSSLHHINHIQSIIHHSICLSI